MIGVRDAFYSKTKRFCSVSCSRSFSSNSKKASILARLQVSPRSRQEPPRKPGRFSSSASCLFLKGKPPTKKAKVLQKQPLVTKLAAYAQHQSSHQGGARKSGGYRSFLTRVIRRVAANLRRLCVLQSPWTCLTGGGTSETER